MEKPDFVTVSLTVTDTATGQVFSGPWEYWDVSPDSASEFLWSDGNYGCDCNRAIFAERLGGPSADDRECGDDRYAVRITTLDGNLLYEDA